MTKIDKRRAASKASGIRYPRTPILNLVDLLKMIGIPLRDWKIHLATGINPPPLEAFLQGNFKAWQERQTKKNFQCDKVVSLIHLHGDQWLFAGVYNILGVREGNKKTPFLYRTKIIPGQEDLIGRVVVKYKRTFRASYLKGHRFGHLLEVSEIKPQKMTLEPFPGYNRVLITFERLRLIVDQNDASWKSALSSVKGVYVIADSKNGGLYVGSATGTDGLWQRWANYAETGHGGNKNLVELLSKKGLTYARNFQFGILEIADFHATDDDIKGREQHWKRVLLSIDQGMNRN